MQAKIDRRVETQIPQNLTGLQMAVSLLHPTCVQEKQRKESSFSCAVGRLPSPGSWESEDDCLHVE